MFLHLYMFSILSLKRTKFIILFISIVNCTLCKVNNNPVQFKAENNTDYKIIRNIKYEIYHPIFRGLSEYYALDFLNDSVIRRGQIDSVFYLNTLNNVSLNFHSHYRDTLNITIYLTKVGSLSISSHKNIKLSILHEEFNSVKDRNPIAKSIIINGVDVNKVDLSGGSVECLRFSNCSINILNLKKSIVKDSLTFENVQLDSADFDTAILPGYLKFIALDLSNVNGNLDLTKIKDIHLPNSLNRINLDRTLKIGETDLDKLNIPYDRFSFHVDSLQDDKKQRWTYEKILKNLEERGLKTNYIYYNEKYMDIVDSGIHRALTNWINEFWWEKGRKKTRVLEISGILFGCFFILNWVFISHFRKVYLPKIFDVYFRVFFKKHSLPHDMKYPWLSPPKEKKISYYSYYTIGIIMYGGSVFWGLRFNYSDIKIKNVWVLAIMTFQYLLGLICVAYLVSFILVN